MKTFTISLRELQQNFTKLKNDLGNIAYTCMINNLHSKHRPTVQGAIGGFLNEGQKTDIFLGSRISSALQSVKENGTPFVLVVTNDHGELVHAIIDKEIRLAPRADLKKHTLEYAV